MNTLWLQRGGDTRGGRLRIAPFGALGHGVQTRLVGEAPGKEGLASGHLKGWGGGLVGENRWEKGLWAASSGREEPVAGGWLLKLLQLW